MSKESTTWWLCSCNPYSVEGMNFDYLRGLTPLFTSFALVIVSESKG